ncbi:MAG: glycosyltransferase family 2 protein [Lachnospiraceae bacterium]|jgi:glycosyltransferase involved in cell wall biosynthesis|nr:glycosyltransferase family 2 protein [Lachnospiraceae bacterium]
MTLQLLVAALQQNPRELAATMNIASDAIIVNQDDFFAYEKFAIGTAQIEAYTFAERGVGLSRNNALLRAKADIVLFSDEDIALDKDYAETIRAEFAAHPKADVILFNVAVDERRRTYWNKTYKRVRWYNYGRYPAYSIAARRARLHEMGVTFSLLFGGGARYGAGEDNLFLHDCLKKGLRIFASPGAIGQETYRESTWFKGYNEKYFYDCGVLYRYLYGTMAGACALRFLLAKKGTMCQEIGFWQAFRLMKKGIKTGAK